MFSFIDSASDHAAALSHFHSYVLFFLILVIVFVVWLLKMILKFVVFERDLRKVSSETFFASLPHINYFFLTFAYLVSNIRDVSQTSQDTYSGFLILNNVTKTYYSYNLTKTIYPDQGNKINVFSIFPHLHLNTRAYNRPYFPGNLSTIYLSAQKDYVTALLNVLRTAMHNIPAVFPYDRVEITSCRPYSSVEEFITIDLYVSAYILALKHLSNARHLNAFLPSNNKWALSKLNVKLLLGFSHLGHNFFYKKYSAFLLPYSLFMNFNTNDIRSMFYLFFQHVRHRKILEWVWTCVPALILLLLLYPSLILLYCYDRPYITKPYLTFKAIGHQWY